MSSLKCPKHQHLGLEHKLTSPLDSGFLMGISVLISRALVATLSARTFGCQRFQVQRDKTNLERLELVDLVRGISH